MLTIAVCGNHRAVYCTESELVWTLKQMGHNVLAFQENAAMTDAMLTLCLAKNVQLFLYVHTHGWTTPGQMSLEQLFDSLRKRGIKTASFHLDRHWGLMAGDQREAKIGRHAFWKTDKVFTADGGHQREFTARGVCHEWLPPAVAERHCWKGMLRPELAYDVIFVGSRRYHPEYKFRTTLIDWLSAVYKERFHRFNGDAGGVVREAKLNDLYASAKVVVGDSCFAGSPVLLERPSPGDTGPGRLPDPPAHTGAVH